MQMPLPPCTSMASLMIERMRSVMWYLQIAEMTLGFSPMSSAAMVMRRVRVHEVGVAADARERLLDALEPADGRLELRADARVGAGGARAELARGHRHRRQRDRAARGQALHQHAPAGARPAPLPPITQSIGMKTSLPVVGPFMNAQPQRVVAPPDVHALVRGRDERERDADVLLAAQELLGIEELEGEAEEGRHRARA